VCLLKIAHQIKSPTVHANVGVDLHVAGLEGHDLGIRGAEVNPARGLDDAWLKISASTSQACFFFCHKLFWFVVNVIERPNDQRSAAAAMRRADCDGGAMAGFAAAY